ncbi:MAG: SDR family oxidoreductase [bacterium]
MKKTLHDKIAVVAGATRGAGRGIARALGEAGATVYCTGRSVRGNPSPYNRPETIEETAELVTAAGGTGIATRVDHTVEAEVRELFEMIDRQQGHIDVLVNSTAGEDPTFAWNKPFWETDFEQGVRLMHQTVFSHMITAKHAAAMMIVQRKGLIVEVTDRNTWGYGGMGFMHDLVKSNVMHFAYVMAEELRKHHVAAVSVMPGYLRSESMLAGFGVTEENWREAGKKDKNFLESESPLYVGRAIAALAADQKAMQWSGEATSSWELARHYGIEDYDGRRPDWITHFAKNFGAAKWLRAGFQREIERQNRIMRRAKQYIGEE